MASTGTSPDADSEPRHQRAGRRAKLGHHLGRPALLVAALGALVVYVRGRDLDGIETRALAMPLQTELLQQHLVLTTLATALVLALVIPSALLAHRPRTRRVVPLVIGLGNAAQAVPSLGLLGGVFFLFHSIDVLPSTGTVPVVASLVAASFLPLLRNTLVGLAQIDAAALEAGRGMGMSERRVLRQLELPLAIPVMLAVLRAALVLNVGTATLAFLVDGGGMGTTIWTGFETGRSTVQIVGALAVAILALWVDYLAGILERLLTPRAIRSP